MALEKQVITVGDANRSYLVAEPPPGPPVSAVLMSLHGTSSTADRQARLSGFEQLSQTASAVVVFPEAIQPIRTGYEWDPGQDVDCEVTCTKLSGRFSGRPLLREVDLTTKCVWNSNGGPKKPR